MIISAYGQYKEYIFKTKSTIQKGLQIGLFLMSTKKCVQKMVKGAKIDLLVREFSWELK